ncbi:MAG: nucleotidyltransferase [Saprospiraceae bacterium]|uniref:Nucleotidyltransferase n=1 Tax=Candidatus Opimibacter skivensis TaxID=2982028 RepID=A0A9D7SSL8_9BACT|nr:nucleotidyltransferase [Candidatus Opimibacter skivensis]
MQNIFNPDFQDFIRALNDSDVKYILVGGYAVIIHGYNRTTGDLDIWVERSAENYQKIIKAFQKFGMPLFDMSLSNFLENTEQDVYTFGRPPVSIDLMLSVKGMNFENVYSNVEIREVEGLEVKVISINELLKAKAASGRSRDIDDIENLTQ